MSLKLSEKMKRLVFLLSEKGSSRLDFLVEHLSQKPDDILGCLKRLESYRVLSDLGNEYKLFEPLYLLDKNKIKNNIDKNINLFVFEKIKSTNDYVKSQSGFKKITVCLSEVQTHGRGTSNKSWVSPFGKNIYLSLGFCLPDGAPIQGLSLIVALTISSLLKSIGIGGVTVKWPNDVFCFDKKIAGILVEIFSVLNFSSENSMYVTIGVGLNVNMLPDLESDFISQPWTSCRKEIGSILDRNELVSKLINRLVGDLKLFNQKSFPYFLPMWRSFDGLFGKPILLDLNGVKICGQSLGVDRDGHLLVQLADSTVKSFSSAEVKLIKYSL